MLKRSLIGIGGFLVASAVTAYASGWPEQMHARPWVILWVGISGLLLVLVGLLATVKSEADNSTKVQAPLKTEIAPISRVEIAPETRVEASPKTEVVGAQSVGNSLTVNIGDLSTKPQPARVITGQESPAPKPRIPNLSLDLVRTRAVLREDEGIAFTNDGDECIALLVRNLPASQGESTRNASSVFASLVFESSDELSHVDRASWVGQESNEISIEVGQIAHIFIGFPDLKGDVFTPIRNPNRFRNHSDWSRVPLLDFERRTFNWRNGSVVYVDIRVVTNEPSIRGTTLAHRRLVLRRQSISYNVKWEDT